MKLKMKLKMSILLMALLMTITPALAFDSINTACEGCHAFPPVFLNNTVSISHIQASPGQTFPVTITWTGGVTAGTNTVAKWPNAVLDNALFNPTPQISPVGVFPSGSLTSTLTAPSAIGNYTLRAYTSDGTGTPNSGKETDYKVITVQVVPPATSAINLTKTPSATRVNSGTSVTYTYIVTNTGGTTLSNVLVTDNILGSIGGPITLAAGANQTFTKSQVITTNTTNIGTATGTSGTTTVSANATATVTVIPPATSAINLTKTPSQIQVTGGTSVTYTYVVANTGGTTLSNVLVTDNILGSIGGPITLNAGASQTFTKSQVITTNTTNIGTATGTDPSGTNVSFNATATVTVIPLATSAISLTKTPSATQVNSGTSVTYTYIVANTGGTTLSNVLVTDNILGSIGGPITLNAGANQTFTKSQVITTNTTNIGTATGTDPSGTNVSFNATATVLVVSVPPSVTFVVTDSITGDPIAGATVSADGKFRGQTDATGTVSFTVAPGDYRYAVRAKGYVRTTGTVSVTGDTTVNVALVPR